MRVTYQVRNGRLDVYASAPQLKLRQHVWWAALAPADCTAKASAHGLSVRCEGDNGGDTIEIVDSHDHLIISGIPDAPHSAEVRIPRGVNVRFVPSSYSFVP